MPRWQKRLKCFYCGCRSAKALPADTRRWECQKCEAVNHLDEHGEITDPPATASQPETRFARARPRSESPRGLANCEDSPFCQRCLQNQMIVKDIVAEYTPPSTGDWEKSYKAYVKDLQETYPPVCDGCETRSRERINQSDYLAGADNLGRLLKRTNESWVDRRGWKYDCVSMILTLGKLMWFVSWIGQFLWHTINLFKPKRQPECVWDDAASPSLFGCSSQILTLRPSQEFCDEVFASLIGWALILGLLSIWWNPMWVKKLRLVYGRPAGRNEYYQLQAMFLALRWAGWNFIAKPGDFELDPQRWKGIHAFMLVVTLLSAILPYRTIRWDSTPRVSRTYSPGSLLAQKPREPRDTSRPAQPDFVSQAQQNFGGNRSTQPTQRFPINQLAQPLQQQFTPQYNPPTPPPDEDAMDWEETRPQQQFDLRPSTSYRDTHQKPNLSPSLTQPSPFYGHLPPNPVSQAHALRNPPYRPPPMERASAQQHNFFSRQKPTPSQLSSSRARADDGDSNNASPAAKRFENDLSPIKMGNQKFFPGNVYNQDTGIEELFAKATTLGKPVPRAAVQKRDGARDAQSSPTSRGASKLVWMSVPVAAAAVAGIAFVVQKGVI